MRTIRLTHGDALLVVDVQNDFLPGGALAVPEGDAVIGPAVTLLQLYADHGLPVFASRCWHPPGHCSFAAQGGPWPPHCIAHTRGAAFPDALVLPPNATVVSKGMDANVEAYSAFRDTPLADQLGARGVERIAVCGLATDYCVLNTVSDALALGFQVLLVLDGVRAVEVSPGDGERAIAQMIARGAVPVHVRGPSLLDEAALVDTMGSNHNGGSRLLGGDGTGGGILS